MDSVLPGAITRLLSATQTADPCTLVCNCIKDTIIVYGTQIVAVGPLALDASIHEVSETIALTTGKQIVVYSLDSRGVCRVSQVLDVECTKLSFISRSLLAVCDKANAVYVYNLETERMQTENSSTALNSEIKNVRGKQGSQNTDLQFVTSGEKTVIWTLVKNVLKQTELPASSVSAWFINDLVVSKTCLDGGAWYIWTSSGQLIGSVVNNPGTMLFKGTDTKFVFSNGEKWVEGSSENIKAPKTEIDSGNTGKAGISEFASPLNTFFFNTTEESLSVYLSNKNYVLQGFDPALKTFIGTDTYTVVGNKLFTKDFDCVSEFEDISFAAENGENRIALIEKGSDVIKVINSENSTENTIDVPLTGLTDDIIGLSCYKSNCYVYTKTGVFIPARNTTLSFPKQLKSVVSSYKYVAGVYGSDLWIYDLGNVGTEFPRTPEYKVAIPPQTEAKLIGNLVLFSSKSQVSVYEINETDATVDLLNQFDVDGVISIAFNGTLLALLTSDHLEVFLKVSKVRNSFVRLQSMRTNTFNEYSPSRVALQGLTVLLASEDRVWKAELKAGDIAEEFNLDIESSGITELIEKMQTVPPNAPGVLECYISALVPIKVDMNFDTAGLSQPEIDKSREIMQFMNTVEHLDPAGVAALYFKSVKSWSYAQLSRTQPDLKYIEEQEAQKAEKLPPSETNDPTVESKPVCVLPWLPVSELRAQIELRAKDLFARTRDPTAVSLEYLALKKKSVLLALWRVASHPEKTKTLNLLKNDFDKDKWRVTAQKNAYALMSKRRALYAAAFFLLGGRITDCVQILSERLHNLPLAVSIARVFDGDNGSGMQFLRTRIEGRVGTWFSFFSLWISGQCLDAVKTLAKSNDISANLLASRYMESGETETKLKRLGVTTNELLNLPLIETVSNAPVYQSQPSKPQPESKPESKPAEQTEKVKPKPKRPTAFDAFFAEDEPEQKSVPLEPDMSAFDAFKPAESTNTKSTNTKSAKKADVQLEPNMDAFAAFNEPTSRKAKDQTEKAEEVKAGDEVKEEKEDKDKDKDEDKDKGEDEDKGEEKEEKGEERKGKDENKSLFSKPRVAAPAQIQLEPDMSAFGF